MIALLVASRLASAHGVAADFEAALHEVRPSTRPWFSAARGVAMFAGEGGQPQLVACTVP
jgi:hypothetical protein